MRLHDTVSKFAYVSIFTYISKCVHVNGVLADSACRIIRRHIGAF